MPQPLPAPTPAPLTSALQLQWESCNVSVLFKENPRLKGFDVRVLGKVLVCPVLPTPGKQGAARGGVFLWGVCLGFLGPPSWAEQDVLPSHKTRDQGHEGWPQTLVGRAASLVPSPRTRLSQSVGGSAPF